MVTWMWGCLKDYKPVQHRARVMRKDLHCTVYWENISSGKYYWKAITSVTGIPVIVVAMIGNTRPAWRAFPIILKEIHSESFAYA